MTTTGIIPQCYQLWKLANLRPLTTSAILSNICIKLTVFCRFIRLDVVVKVKNLKVRSKVKSCLRNLFYMLISCVPIEKKEIVSKLVTK